MNDIVEQILLREGGFVNHSADPGGPTNWGITLKTWTDFKKRPVFVNELKEITREEAADFYATEFLLKPGYTGIIDPFLRGVVVDCAVNHGIKRASMWLQRAVGVEMDGVVGPVTLAAVNSSARNPLSISVHILTYRLKFYTVLVKRDLGQLVFLTGWNNRVTGLLEDLARKLAGG